MLVSRSKPISRSGLPNCTTFCIRPSTPTPVCWLAANILSSVPAASSFATPQSPITLARSPAFVAASPPSRSLIRTSGSVTSCSAGPVRPSLRCNSERASATGAASPGTRENTA